MDEISRSLQWPVKLAEPLVSKPLTVGLFFWVNMTATTLKPTRKTWGQKNLTCQTCWLVVCVFASLLHSGASGSFLQRKPFSLIRVGSSCNQGCNLLFFGFEWTSRHILANWWDKWTMRLKRYQEVCNGRSQLLNRWSASRRLSIRSFEWTLQLLLHRRQGWSWAGRMSHVGCAESSFVCPHQVRIRQPLLEPDGFDGMLYYDNPRSLTSPFLQR